MSRKRLNVHKHNRKDWCGPKLCPLKTYHFGIDNHMVNSIEGFMFTMRLPPNDSRRIVTLMDSSTDARRIAGRIKPKPFGWWNGRKVEIDSKEFHHLFERVMRARFRKDRRAVAALMASRGKKIVHERPRQNSPLSVVPIKLYCRILEKFRDELFDTGEIAKSAA